VNTQHQTSEHFPRRQPDSTDSTQVNGVVENIVYRSEDTGYTVCAVRTEGRDEVVTVVGNCPAIWVGENLKADGAWVHHKQHGYQFKAETMTCIAPTTAKGIERYLASGMIKGIGKVMAERLVRAFGDDTLAIIEKESKRLEEVEGIGASRRQAIKESWIAQKGVRDVMIFLQSHGVGIAQSARIFDHYGSNAIAMITENPYRLCTDIWGIGFKTADKFAMSMGVPAESELRARAGVIHVLSTFIDEGHCYCIEAELILHAAGLLTIPVEVIAPAINHEVKSGRLIRESDRIYRADIHAAEVSVAAKIARLCEHKAGFKPIDVDKAVDWAAQQVNIAFAPMQAEALKTALSEKVSIITGGPGVGKTTIIKALVDVFKKRGLTVFLAAPTGRAAKRMSEATRHDASTIHRLLKFQPGTREFEHGPQNPLKGDVFILDEVSMVDINLMDFFLGALPDAGCLILVGDSDQLPSVGPGNVLRDMIGSSVIPCSKLETIFRQEKGGWIVRNAHRVNAGEMIESPPPDEDSDFYFVQATEPDQVIKMMLALVKQRIPDRFGFDPMNDIQVLTPMRRNELGAENLNSLLQAELNPPGGPEVERFGKKYRLRDRVMQIRNNYDKEVFNGDIGRIVSVRPDDHAVDVDFDGRTIRYDTDELDEMVHAYACSIHKSQGSEFPAVVILLATQHFKLLQRNLLYTAITRGRKLVCLVGSSKAVFIATQNNEIHLRRTTLRQRLQTHLDGRSVVLDESAAQ
jgi:exodeoxyribonuclease V alpha subunit